MWVKSVLCLWTGEYKTEIEKFELKFRAATIAI